MLLHFPENKNAASAFVIFLLHNSLKPFITKCSSFLYNAPWFHMVLKRLVFLKAWIKHYKGAVTWQCDEDLMKTVNVLHPHVHLDQTELGDTTNWSQVEEKAHQTQLILMRETLSCWSVRGRQLSAITEEWGLSEKQEKLEQVSKISILTHLEVTSQLSLQLHKSVESRVSSHSGRSVGAEALLSQFNVQTEEVQAHN